MTDAIAVYTSKENEEFFGAIGRLTISWAHLELGLDCMVHILYDCFQGSTIEAEKPVSLKRKISFLRGSLKKLILDENAINNYMKLFDDILNLAEKRHDIIHGIVIEQIEHSGEATMVRVTRKKDGVVKREYKATTISILRTANEVQKFSGSVLNWVDAVYKLIEELRPPADGQRAT